MKNHLEIRLNETTKVKVILARTGEEAVASIACDDILTVDMIADHVGDKTVDFVLVEPYGTLVAGDRIFGLSKFILETRGKGYCQHMTERKINSQ